MNHLQLKLIAAAVAILIVGVAVLATGSPSSGCRSAAPRDRRSGRPARSCTGTTRWCRAQSSTSPASHRSWTCSWYPSTPMSKAAQAVKVSRDGSTEPRHSDSVRWRRRSSNRSSRRSAVSRSTSAARSSCRRASSGYVTRLHVKAPLERVRTWTAARGDRRAGMAGGAGGVSVAVRCQSDAAAHRSAQAARTATAVLDVPKHDSRIDTRAQNAVRRHARRADRRCGHELGCVKARPSCPAPRSFASTVWRRSGSMRELPESTGLA